MKPIQSKILLSMLLFATYKTNTMNIDAATTDDGIRSATNSTASLKSARSGDRLAESDGPSASSSHLRAVSPVDGVAGENFYVPPRSVTPNPTEIAPTTPAASAPAGTSSPAPQTIHPDKTVTAATPTGDAAAPTSISTPASLTISNLRAATADLPEMKDSTGVADDAPYEPTPAPTGVPAASTAPTLADTPPALPATPTRADTPALPTVNVKYPDFFNLMDQPEFIVVQDPLALITYVDKLKSIVIQTTHDTWGTGKASEVTDIADINTVYAWTDKLYNTAASASPAGRCTIVPKAQFEQIIGKLKNLVERYAQEGISVQVNISLNDSILNNVIFDDVLASFDSGTDALPAQSVSAGDDAPPLPATPSPAEKEENDDDDDDDGDAAPALPTSPSPAHMEIPESQSCGYLPAEFVKELATCAQEVRDAINRKISTSGIDAATDFDDSNKILTWAEALNTSVERNSDKKIVIPSNSLQQILTRLRNLAQHYSPASFSDDSFATEFMLYDPTKSTQMSVFNQHINFGSEESNSDSSTGSYSVSDDGNDIVPHDNATSPIPDDNDYAFVIVAGNCAHCAEAQLVAYAQNVLDRIQHYIRQGDLPSDTRDKGDAQAIVTWAQEYRELKESHSFMLVPKKTLDKALTRLDQLAKLYQIEVIPLESATNYTNRRGMGCRIGTFISDIDLAPEIASQPTADISTRNDDDGIPSLADTVWDDATEYRTIEDKNALLQYAQEIKNGINARIDMMSQAEVQLAEDTLTRDYSDATAIINWAQALQKSPATVIAGATIKTIIKRLHYLARIYTNKKQTVISWHPSSRSGLIFESEIKLSDPTESESEKTTCGNDDDNASASESSSAASDDSSSQSTSNDDDDDGGSKSDDDSCDGSESENGDDAEAASRDDGSGSRSRADDFTYHTQWPTNKTKCVLVESHNTAELKRHVRQICTAIADRIENISYSTSTELNNDQSAWDDALAIKMWAELLNRNTKNCRKVVPHAIMMKVLKKLETLAHQYRVAHLADDFFIARTGDCEILQANEGDGHPTIIFCHKITLPSEKTTNSSTHGSMGDGSTSDDESDDKAPAPNHPDDTINNKPKALRDPITPPNKPVVTQSSFTGQMLKIVTNKFVITGSVVAAVAWYYYYYMTDTRAERDTDQPETAKTTLKQTNLKPVEV